MPENAPALLCRVASRRSRTIPLALLCAAAASLTTGLSASVPQAGLAELKARAPKENNYPDFNPQFHQEVVSLVESNTLVSGDDFFRAAQMASGPIRDYRGARMRYELLLAAAAKNQREAEKLVAANWDQLLSTLGRTARFGTHDSPTSQPGSDDSPIDPMPKVIQAVLENPANARKAASLATDNPEVQRIVDADQAVRTDWSKLTQADLAAIQVEDQRRNTRIRVIVNEGALHTAKDFANASLVMQHSSGFKGFQLAHELAVGSMLLGDRGLGRWLVAATYDRMLRSLGHDQRFGTQGAPTIKPAAKPKVAEVDEAGICDAERLALGCPTLAAKRADFMTARPKD